jgi:hypothetical protein
VLPTLARSMEQVSVCARVLLRIWLANVAIWPTNREQYHNSGNFLTAHCISHVTTYFLLEFADVSGERL